MPFSTTLPIHTSFTEILFLFTIPFLGFSLAESSMANTSRVESLNSQVLDMISSMEKIHMVDHRLRKAWNLREKNGPSFSAELIPTFNNDAYRVLAEMNATSAKTDLDYGHLEGLCLKMEGKTASVGACRMDRAIGRLYQAIDEKSKDECIDAFEILKNEYLSLNWMLEWIAELERRILSHKTNDP